jgi:hypothetical protein
VKVEPYEFVFPLVAQSMTNSTSSVGGTQ